jgi:hypothetical protein
MAISPVLGGIIRLPHHLGGVARSRSIFVATPLPGFRLPARSRFGEGRGAPAKRDFAKLNLHLPACRSLGAGRTLFEQPGRFDFFQYPANSTIHVLFPLSSLNFFFPERDVSHRFG